MYRLAIYGKGGIGKSTTAGNLATLLAARGYTVMLIGCDPKADSTRLPMRGIVIPSVLDGMRSKLPLSLDDIVFQAPSGILCVEAGGPVPGVGCAGRGIIAAFDLLDKLEAYQRFKPDYVIYDVLGDVVCGGFAMPLRGNYADEAMVVTSGEMMSLYAASNIIKAITSFSDRNYAHFGGLIVNQRNIENENEKIAEFCIEEGVEVVGTIPRCSAIQKAEDAKKTVVEAYPLSEAVKQYEPVIEHIIEAARND